MSLVTMGSVSIVGYAPCIESLRVLQLIPDIAVAKPNLTYNIGEDDVEWQLISSIDNVSWSFAHLVHAGTKEAVFLEIDAVVRNVGVGIRAPNQPILHTDSVFILGPVDAEEWLQYNSNIASLITLLGKKVGLEVFEGFWFPHVSQIRVRHPMYMHLPWSFGEDYVHTHTMSPCETVHDPAETSQRHPNTLPIVTCWPSEMMAEDGFYDEMKAIQPTPFYVWKKDGSLVHTCSVRKALIGAKVKAAFSLHAFKRGDSIQLYARDEYFIILD